MDLPHLKMAATGNAKYRRRVTSPAMRDMIGKAAVEWSLKTRDPAKIVERWKEADARFEALLAKAEGTTSEQARWDLLRDAAVAHGLAAPDATKIGPVDHQLESGRFDAFTAAALAEADKLTPQQARAKFGEGKAVTAFELLAKAQLFGVERPPLPLSEVAKAYLRDRESRSGYHDIEKQVGMVVAALGEVVGKADPAITSINRTTAYAFRDKLAAKGNSLGTIRRRITTIRAVLNHAERRFDLPNWRNPFNRIELPEDDGVAGEEKRLPLTLDEIRKVRPVMSRSNDDLQGIYHLMMFTGLSPDEARGLQWDEVHLDDPTPHFEVRPNGRRRLKKGQRRRRVPLVGSALTMMRERRQNAAQGTSDVFPRYCHQRNANALSASLVKPMKAAGVWQKTVKVPYSLRHSVKDWLRRAAPTNMQLLIMGHGHGEGRVAGGYGDDDLLDMQARHLEAALRRGGVIDYPALPDPEG